MIFMIIWLSFWTVGGIISIRELAAHADWLAVHWKLVFQSSPLGSVTFPIKPDDTRAVVFLAQWLVGWCLGEITVLAFLSRLLLGADTITLTENELVSRKQVGPFHWTWWLPRASIKLLALSSRDDAVVAGTDSGRTIVTSLGPAAERKRICTELQGLLGDKLLLPLPSEAAPAGWVPGKVVDQWTELVRSPEVFQAAIPPCTWMLAFLLAAASPEVISPLSSSTACPSGFASSPDSGAQHKRSAS